MLKIKKNILDSVIAHAYRDIPIEACGYLASKNGIVSDYIMLTNLDASGEHFTMDPKEQFSAVKAFREKGLKPVAVYHSHPESPARPSEEDIKLAHDPQISYVIISLMDEDAVIKSFKIIKGVVESEEIEIIQ